MLIRIIFDGICNLYIPNIVLVASRGIIYPTSFISLWTFSWPTTYNTGSRIWMLAVADPGSHFRRAKITSVWQVNVAVNLRSFTLNAVHSNCVVGLETGYLKRRADQFSEDVSYNAQPVCAFNLRENFGNLRFDRQIFKRTTSEVYLGACLPLSLTVLNSNQWELMKRSIFNTYLTSSLSTT